MKLRGPYLTMVVGVLAAAALGLASANANDAAIERVQRAANQQANPPAQPDGGDKAPAETPAQNSAAEPTEPPASAQPNKAPARKTIFAGSVEGGAASIAVSVKGDKAIAYICDGKKVEAWLSGSVAGNQVTLSGAGNASLNAEISGNRLAGTVIVKRKTFTFDVKAAKKPSGLYQAAATVRGARVVGSWIILPDGTQVGVITTDGEPGPAPAFDTGNGTVGVEGGDLIVMPVGPDGGN